MAQTFRSGTNDIDAMDFADLFLDDEDQIDPDELNELYVLVNFRPAVTNRNWRMDCGVAGYDNTFGLPPFFPTRLRFEDYIYRLWIQQDGIAAAHVDAAQNHTRTTTCGTRWPPRSSTRRCPTCSSGRSRTSLHAGGRAGHRVRLRGRGDGRGRASRSSTSVAAIHGRALEAAGDTAQRRSARTRCGCSPRNLEKAFYGFEPDFFQQNLLRIVDDVVGDIQGSHRAVADAGRDLLLPQAEPRAAADAGGEPEEEVRRLGTGRPQPRSRLPAWITRPPATIRAPPIKRAAEGRSPKSAQLTTWLTTKKTAM